MTHTAEDKYSDTELTTICMNKMVNEEFVHYLITFYKKIYQDLWQDENGDIHWMEEEDGMDFKDIVLKIAIDQYLLPFKDQIKWGHSAVWADLIASSIEDTDVAINNAYRKIIKDQPELAKKELEIYCQSINEDELFTKYFLFLHEIGDGGNEITKHATQYRDTYKGLIEEGKSELFAHEYADYQLKDESNSVGCYVYADSYEKLLKQGKSKEYAIEFAETYSDFLGDQLSDINDYIAEDDCIEMYYRKSIAHMHAWEYIQVNKEINKERFFFAYENAYLNTYFADAGTPQVSEEKLNEMVLEKINYNINRA